MQTCLGEPACHSLGQEGSEARPSRRSGVTEGGLAGTLSCDFSHGPEASLEASGALPQTTGLSNPKLPDDEPSPLGPQLASGGGAASSSAWEPHDHCSFSRGTE